MNPVTDVLCCRRLLQHASADVEKMILGNKCDMESKRQITTERGHRLAEDYGVKFFETSARDSVNVEAAFYEFAKAIKVPILFYSILFYSIVPGQPKDATHENFYAPKLSNICHQNVVSKQLSTLNFSYYISVVLAYFVGIIIIT